MSDRDAMTGSVADLKEVAARRGWTVKEDASGDVRITAPGGGSYAISVYDDESGNTVMMGSWCWDFEQGEYDFSEPQPFDMDAAVRYLGGDVTAIDWEGA